MKRIIYAILLVLGLFFFVIYLATHYPKSARNICEIHNIADLNAVNLKDYDSVKISASSLYRANTLKALLQGSNYRESWQDTIKAPILYLDTLFGGVTVVKEGGGKQTKSIRVRGNKGLVLTLRSVNKNPKPLVPETLEHIGLENIVTDGISGQHPYAAPVVAKLSDAIGIYHTKPKLVFLPKQSTLNAHYNHIYSNKLYWLEYENKGHFNWANLKHFTRLVDTETLQHLKNEHKGNLTIDKSLLVRSRLFDVVIGDWDRHAKQWGWFVTANNSTLKALPLPMDRDNAFFYVDGLLPHIISNPIITPHLRPFNNDVDDIEGLVYDFDVYFLQGTTLNQFISQAEYIKKTLTDTVIENAFKQCWPKKMLERDAPKIIEKIIARRNGLIDIAIMFRTVLDSRPLLNKPLKGSEPDDTTASRMACFEC